MAKRIFKLPDREELTKQQRQILRLPVDGQYLIIGAPGTGKSVVALWRARLLYTTTELEILTFNHVLRHANEKLLEKEIGTNAAISWFYKLFSKLYSEWKGETLIPERADFKPDYEKILEDIEEANFENTSTYHLIIDEGQDLPPGWYDCVIELGYENVFIVADQNQQITDENSSKKMLMNMLGLNSVDVIELTGNWRNTTPIAAFANYFYIDKTTPKPELPARPSINIPILYEYENIDRMKEQILREYDRDPSKLIGFFVPTENKRECWERELKKDDVERKNNKPVVSSYSANNKGKVNIDFSFGGIVVLNNQSVKGIEFDIVFIIIDDFKSMGSDTELLKKKFYVMTSRARERLALFKCAARNSIVEKILPPEGETVTVVSNGKERKIELMKRVKI